MDDIHLANEIRNHEAQLRQRAEQKQLVANTLENSEPNGGQVDHADPGVGRNDVPDSF